MVLSEIMPFVRVKSRRNNGCPPIAPTFTNYDFMHLGTMLNSVADFAGVFLSTACRIVAYIAAIARLYGKILFWALGPQTNFIISFSFLEYMVPLIVHTYTVSLHVGTYFYIPHLFWRIGEEYRNRKGYFSINVQPVCDADLKLLNVVARWPGSIHDSSIFNDSILRARYEESLLGNHWLLGDSAYLSRSYLLAPLLNPSTMQEIRYNEAHIKTRNTIELTFAVWKHRFPIISRTMKLSLEDITKVIMATAALHNICRNYSIEEMAPEVELPRESVVTVTSENLENNITHKQEIIYNYF